MADTLERTEHGTNGNGQELMQLGDKGLELRSLNDAWRFAAMVAKSELCPKDFKGKPESVLIAMQMGYEVGLQPMQALQNIAVINGRPTLWGDAMLAIVEDSGLLEDFWEELEGQGDQMVAVCYSKRPNRSKGRTTRFSVADANAANLWGKSGPWSQYPKRMLQMRARGWNLRDNYPDVLKGMHTREEAIDMPSSVTIDVESKPAVEDATAVSRADRLAQKLQESKQPPEAPQEAAVEPDEAEPQADAAPEPEDGRDLTPRQKIGSFLSAELIEASDTFDADDVLAFLSWMLRNENAEPIKALGDLTRDDAEVVFELLGDGRFKYGLSPDKLAQRLDDWNAAKQMAAEEDAAPF